MTPDQPKPDRVEISREDARVFHGNAVELIQRNKELLIIAKSEFKPFVRAKIKDLQALIARLESALRWEG